MAPAKRSGFSVSQTFARTALNGICSQFGSVGRIASPLLAAGTEHTIMKDPVIGFFPSRLSAPADVPFDPFRHLHPRGIHIRIMAFASG